MQNNLAVHVPVPVQSLLIATNITGILIELQVHTRPSVFLYFYFFFYCKKLNCIKVGREMCKADLQRWSECMTAVAEESKWWKRWSSSEAADPPQLFIRTPHMAKNCIQRRERRLWARVTSRTYTSPGNGNETLWVSAGASVPLGHRWSPSAASAASDAGSISPGLHLSCLQEVDQTWFTL